MTKNEIIDVVREALKSWDATGFDDFLWDMMVKLNDEQEEDSND